MELSFWEIAMRQKTPQYWGLFAGFVEGLGDSERRMRAFGRMHGTQAHIRLAPSGHLICMQVCGNFPFMAVDMYECGRWTTSTIAQPNYMV